MLLNNIDAISYIVCTAVLDFGLWSIATWFGHYVLTYSGSSYKITKRMCKSTMPHVLNKINM